MMGLINRIEPSAQRARVSADHLPHWGSSVTTSRMTLLSTRMAVIGDQPRVRARISSVLIRVEALPRIRAIRSRPRRCVSLTFLIIASEYVTYPFLRLACHLL